MAFGMDSCVEQWGAVGRKVDKRNLIDQLTSMSKQCCTILQGDRSSGMSIQPSQMLITLSAVNHSPGAGNEHISLKLLSRAKSSVAALNLDWSLYVVL